MKSSAETYFAALAEIRATGGGVEETSYYPALINLLNAVGATLKPRVLAVSQLKNTGAGNPEAGLFAAGQFPKGAGEPLPGQLPERGTVEIKSVAEDGWLTAGGAQVSKYWEKYRLVLVTNYQDFLLVGEDRAGRPTVLESLRLAESAEDFRARLAQPRAFAQARGERLLEYLKRVLLCAAPLNNPRDVAWFLASYARDARARLEEKPDLPALAALRGALENALGLGLLGLYGAAIAKARGARAVIGLDTVAGRRERSRRFGVDLALDPATTDQADLLRQVREICRPEGADAVLEVCGVPDVIPLGIEMLRVGGTYVLGGVVNPNARVTLDASLVLRKLLTLRGVHNYHPRNLVEALDFVVANRWRFPFHDLVDGRYPLDRIDEAMTDAAARRVLRAAVIP